MNKNVFLRVASMTLVAGILLTSFGCKKEGEGEGETTTAATTAEVHKGEIAVPSTQDGTFKIDKTIVEIDAGTTKKDGTTRIEEESGELYYIIMDDSLDKGSENLKKYITERHGELGIDKAKAEEMIKSGTTWNSVTIFVYVLNSDSKGVAMKSVEAKQTESLIVDTELESEIGIPMGRGMYIPVSAYVDVSKFETEEQIVAALNGMDIKVAYTYIDNPMDSVDDWSKVKISYMPIKF